MLAPKVSYIGASPCNIGIRGRYPYECSVDSDANCAILILRYADRLGVENWYIREMECPRPAKI